MVIKIAKPPAKIPEAPKPAIALPTIRALDDGASAQTKLPTSKIATYVRYANFFEKRTKLLPVSGWVVHLRGTLNLDN